MTTLPNAPLIEAIFELRWGGVQKSPNDFHYNIPASEIELLPGQFRSVASDAGFTFYERVNPDAPPLPHLISHRYRQASNQWPCYQLGSGIFTVNQVNDGYSWPPFKQAILKGYELLEKAHFDSLKNGHLMSIDLRYQDGFILEDGETPKDFLHKKICVGFDLPTDFMSGVFLNGEPLGHNISFSVPVTTPVGNLIISLKQAHINGTLGFVMDTLVRTMGADMVQLDVGNIDAWLENAHAIQRHTFDTLIDRKLQETFK